MTVKYRYIVENIYKALLGDGRLITYTKQLFLVTRGL